MAEPTTPTAPQTAPTAPATTDVPVSSSPGGDSSPPQATTRTPQAPAVPTAGGDDPFSRFDAEFEQPKKTEEKPKEPSDKEPVKPAVAPDEPDEKIKDPKPLRERLKQVRSDLATKEKTLADMQARLKELEDKGKDSTALTGRISELEKQIAEKEGELRKAEFKASPDFEKNYSSKWNRMTTTASGEIQTLSVGRFTTDEATGERQFTPERKAEWTKDFVPIYSLPRPEARARARQLFSPEEADLVMENYTALHRFQSEMNDALESEKTEWQKSRDSERAQKTQREEQFKGACDAAQKDLEGKFPQWYAADPADKKTEELLKEGWNIVNMKPGTFQQAVILSTRNRMNAAAAPMLQYRLTQVQQKLAEAEATIAQLKGSKPGQGGSATVPNPQPKPEPDHEEWAREAREMLSK